MTESSPSPHPISRISGFTLIELLVVVAIIALLIAILLPSLGKAKARAKITQCASNLHALGQGINVYAAEWQQWLPPQRGEAIGDPSPSNHGYTTTALT